MSKFKDDDNEGVERMGMVTEPNDDDIYDNDVEGDVINIKNEGY